MTHHTERSSLDQLMIFFNCHVHGEKAAERDDGPPAQEYPATNSTTPANANIRP